MNRRTMFLTAAAAFAIGVAFAAQPTSVRADRHSAPAERRDPWMPGANMVMSAHESDAASPAPPR